MSVSGRLSVGLVRCTGKYDNISFRIKNPFFFFFLYQVFIAVVSFCFLFHLYQRKLCSNSVCLFDRVFVLISFPFFFNCSVL